MKNVVRTSGGTGSDDATVFPSLEHLELKYLPELQEICNGPISSTSFQNLKDLKIRNCESMKNVVRTSGGSDDTVLIPSTEHLELNSLPELQEICDGPISSTSFDNLKELKLDGLKALTQIWKSTSVCENNNAPHFSNLSTISISQCDRLRNLEQLSMAGKDCLPQLEQLSISFCEMMEQVFLWNDEEEAIVSHVIRKVLPKLKKVSLVSLPNLKTFYQGIEGIEFPLLEEMKIEYCPKMKSIIIKASNEKSNSGEITSSTADQHIDDDHCLHLFCQSEKVSLGSNLEVLCIHLNPFCGHEIPSSLFNGLKELTINKYEGSMSLFTLSVAAHLVSLSGLYISNCDEMIKVIEDEQQQQRILLFPKLVTLCLDDLPKLVSFCNWKCEIELPLLWEVKIRMCPNMKSFSLGFVATPNLEAFATDLSTYVGVGVDVAFNSLKKLKIFENESPRYDDKISVSIFNRLEQLTFRFCKCGMSLFSPSAVGNLVNLRVLEIGACDEMLVKVIEDEEEKEDEKVVSGVETITSVVIFPKLEELGLWGLHNLVRFCEWKCDVELPSLRQVEIAACPNIESVSMGFVAAPNLKIVLIDGHKDIVAPKDLNAALHQHNYLAHRGKVKEEEEEEEDDDEEEKKKLW